MHYQKTIAGSIANALIYFVLILGALSCVLPLINVLAISFSSSVPATAGQVKLLPVGFTVNAYQYVLEKKEFVEALWVSVERVVLGLTINTVFTVITAYPLSKTKSRFQPRNVFMWYFVGAMLFSGGLIPTYLMVSATGLMGSIFSLIIPGALPIWNMIILINFFRELPGEIEEAALIDGAGHFTALTKIYVPLSKPALATLALFTIVGHWNNWFDALIYINRPENYPLQTYLQTVLTKQDYSVAATISSIGNLSDRTIKAAQIIIGSIPIFMVYPFLQKYFTQGIVMGSVKG